MSEFTTLLFGHNTPMDVAEKAAMRKLMEMDLARETEWENDYSRENSIAGFPGVNSSFCLGVNKKQ